MTLYWRIALFLYWLRTGGRYFLTSGSSPHTSHRKTLWIV